ncbi:cyclin-C [Pycnococcus provasolii]
MASSFWTSSHSRLLFTAAEIHASNRHDANSATLNPVVSQPTLRRLRAFYASYLFELGRLCKVRARVVFTSIVYLRRFYLHRSFSTDDPRTIAPACLYLASKVEECPVQAKLVAYFAKKISQQTPSEVANWGRAWNGALGDATTNAGERTTAAAGDIDGVVTAAAAAAAAASSHANGTAADDDAQASKPPAPPTAAGAAASQDAACQVLLQPPGVNELLRAEMVVLKQLEAYLIVHHPLRALPSYLHALGIPPEGEGALRVYGVLSDSYRCDVCLMEPPHVLALGAAFLACASACSTSSSTAMRGSPSDAAASEVLREAMPRFEQLEGISVDDFAPFARHMLDYYEGDAAALRTSVCRDALANALGALVPPPTTAL